MCRRGPNRSHPSIKSNASRTWKASRVASVLHGIAVDIRNPLESFGNALHRVVSRFNN